MKLATTSPRREPVLDHRFSYEMFVAGTDGSRERLAHELAEELVRRLQASSDPANTAYECIEDLKGLGHDLWSFDESDDFQKWCGNWTAPKTAFELIVGFTYREQQAPTASVAFKPLKTESLR
jgi:hypothetical protein